MNTSTPEDRERSVVNVMMDALDRKTELALQYEATATLDDLLVIAAERFAIATFTAMNVFRASHLPGVLWLRLLKFVAPGRYRTRMDSHNALFAQCLIHAADRLLGYIRAWHGPATELLYDNLVTWSAAWYANMLRYGEAEKAVLQGNIVRALAERDKFVESQMPAGDLILRRDKLRRELRALKSRDDLTATGQVGDSTEFVSADEMGHLERIMFSMRKEPSRSEMVEMAEYIAACTLHDPVVSFVQPRWLAKNLSRFTRQEESA